MTKEWIRRKRDGQENRPDELEALVEGYVRGEIRDYQVSAWLMAVYFQGLSHREASALTRAMWRSGLSFPRGSRADYWIDKHSTGGVGDKTSLILVPLVASVCRRLFGTGAVRIPMVSGRGLGHSGGTLDKLESVPGFQTSLKLDQAMDLLEANDFFMMGQTPDLAPADRLLYALRDVTATVESIPLIVSSIMSKKLAESLDGLVFDVKIGSGAFMKTEAEAIRLAEGLLGVARLHGVDGVAAITRMDEPLGYKVGNHLEVEECADFLEGTRRERGLEEVVLALAGQMVRLASRKKLGLAEAERACRAELDSAEPLDCFRKMFAAQGGRWDDYEKNRQRVQGLPRFEWRAPREGYVRKVEAHSLGVLVNELGGGRDAKEDKIDPLVGIELKKKVGEPVHEGEITAMVYYRDSDRRELIERCLNEAISVGGKPAPSRSWVVEFLE